MSFENQSNFEIANNTIEVEMTDLTENPEVLSTEIPENQKNTIEVRVQDNIILPLNSENLEENLEGIKKIRKLIIKSDECVGNPTINALIRGEILPKLVKFLRDGTSIIQIEACLSLINMAAESSDQTALIVESGAVQVLISHLGSDDETLLMNSIWALANIVADSEKYRDYCMSQGILVPLLRTFVNKKGPVTKTAIWALSNLFHGKNPPPDFSVLLHCLPLLSVLIRDSSSEILIEICKILANICEDSAERTSKVIEAGFAPRLVKFLKNEKSKLVKVALDALATILKSGENHAEDLTDSGILKYLTKLLDKKSQIDPNASLLISTICNGSSDRVQDAIEAGIFPRLIKRMIRKSNDIQIRRDATRAIVNATNNGTFNQISYLVNLEIIPHLLDLLESKDDELVNSALDGIVNILKKGEKTKSLVGINLFQKEVDEYYEDMENDENNEDE